MPAWRGGGSSHDTAPERRLEVTVWSTARRSERTAQSQCFLTRGLGSSRERTGTGLRGRGRDLTQGDVDAKEGPDTRRLLGGRPCATSN